MLIKSYADLFTRVRSRPPLDEMLRLQEGLELEGFLSRGHHPLSLPKRKRRLFYAFLGLYRRRGLISPATYAGSWAYSWVYLLAKSSYLFLRNRFLLVRLTSTVIDGERVQFTRGAANIVSCFFGGSSVLDVPCETARVRFTPSQRLRLLRLLWRNLSPDVWHAAQHLILELQLEGTKVSAREFVVEEGGDYTVSVVTYLVRSRIPTLTLTLRTPYFYAGRPGYGFDRILTNNRLDLAALVAKNPRVELVAAFPDVVLAKRARPPMAAPVLGFFADIGNYLLNRRDKIRHDQAMAEFAAAQGVSLRVTVHPQERTLNRAYYREHFPDARFREQGTMDEWLDGVDVVAGWWSTIVFQAFCKRVPVILLDFAGDGQGAAFEAWTDGMVVRARDEAEFVAHWHRFRAMEVLERDQRYDRAFTRLFT